MDKMDRITQIKIKYQDGEDPAYSAAIPISTTADHIWWDDNTSSEDGVEDTDKRRKLSAIIGTIPQKGVSIASQIGSLQTRAKSAEDEIDTLKSRATSAEGEIDTLKNRATSAEGEIDTLKGRATTLEGKAEELETSTTNLWTQVGEDDESGLRKKAKDLDNRINLLDNATDGRVTSLESRMDKLDTEGTGEVPRLEARVTVLDDDDNNGRIKQIENRVAVLDGNNGEIANLKAKDTTLETSITSIEGRFNESGQTKLLKIENGGTNASDAAGARQNLGAAAAADLLKIYVPNGSDTSGQSFGKNFLNTTQQARNASYFIIDGAATKSSYQNIPTKLDTQQFPIVGLRQVIMVDANSFFIRVTQMHPNHGRIHSNYTKNNSSWEGWKVVGEDLLPTPGAYDNGKIVAVNPQGDYELTNAPESILIVDITQSGQQWVASKTYSEIINFNGPAYARVNLYNSNKGLITTLYYEKIEGENKVLFSGPLQTNLLNNSNDILEYYVTVTINSENTVTMSIQNITITYENMTQQQASQGIVTTGKLISPAVLKSAITKAVSGITSFSFKIITQEELQNLIDHPETAQSNIVYLVQQGTTDTYDEYALIEGEITHIGSTGMDVSPMKGATATAKGEQGLVPAPLAGQQNTFLRGDGTWSSFNIPTASVSNDGLMTASDKIKLNTVATDAEANQNAFSNIKIGSTTLSAKAKTDTFEISAGSNISIATNEASNKITLSATDTVYSFVDNNPTLAWGTKSKIATIGGVDIHVTMPANPNTDHYAWSDITGKPGITNNTSLQYINYNSNLMTTNTLAYWNGAYNSSGNSNLTKLGTVDKGVWRGSAIAIGYGGTGATTAAAARSNLGLSDAAVTAVSTIRSGISKANVTGALGYTPPKYLVQSGTLSASTNPQTFTWTGAKGWAFVGGSVNGNIITCDQHIKQIVWSNGKLTITRDSAGSYGNATLYAYFITAG